MPIFFDPNSNLEYVACYRGIERSRLIEQAAKKLEQCCIQVITGGMIELARLSSDDIRQIYGQDSHFTLITDESDMRPARETSEKCQELLTKARIRFSLASNLDVIIYAQKAGIDPSLYSFAHAQTSKDYED